MEFKEPRDDYSEEQTYNQLKETTSKDDHYRGYYYYLCLLDVLMPLFDLITYHIVQAFQIVIQPLTSTT